MSAVATVACNTQLTMDSNESHLDMESEIESVDENDATVCLGKCSEALESEDNPDINCNSSAISTYNANSVADNGLEIVELQTINANDTDVEIDRPTESLPVESSQNERGAAPKSYDPSIMGHVTSAIEHTGYSGNLPSETDDYSNDISDFPCADKESNSSDFSTTIETSLLLPLFEQFVDDDFEANDTEHVGLLFERSNTDLSQQIPNFEMLHLDAHGIHDIGSRFDQQGDDDDLRMIDILKEIRKELVSRTDEDFGLLHLFDDAQQRSKQTTTLVKSKAARKRKKQQQKLRKCVANPYIENSRRKFAQSFQELQKSQVVFDDHDIDQSITCPVCLEMYHMPCTCNPCSHVFCDPCLRRLTGQGSEGIPCPLCRTVISSCELNKDFDEYLSLAHPGIYTARAMLERHTKFRHYHLPFTPPVPLGKRLLRQLIASRNSQSDTRWMSHDWFKFLLGCTAGMCLSLLIMLFNRVKSVRDARDVNIVFLSIIIGAFVTFLIFKYMKI